ncbi:hypothetical protein RAS2_26240 [Phycisphaerae bacterium RAS2]|nr:hypothetical protein RAS2_26240 [Phycisphaerae bacterium RAS2]
MIGTTDPPPAGLKNVNDEENGAVAIVRSHQSGSKMLKCSRGSTSTGPECRRVLISEYAGNVARSSVENNAICHPRAEVSYPILLGLK